MAEASIVQDGIDRVRDAFENIEDEAARVQKQLRSRRRKLEKQLDEAKDPARVALEAKLRAALRRRTAAIRRLDPAPRPVSLAAVAERMLPGERILYYRVIEKEAACSS